MFDVLYRLIPIEIRVTPEGERKAKILILSSLYFGLFMLFGAFTLTFFFYASALRVLPVLIYSTVMSVLCLVTPLILNKSRSLAIAALPILVSYVTIPIISGFGYGGITAPFVPLLLFLPLLTHFFGNDRISAFSCVFILFILGLLRYFESQGWVGLSVLEPSMRSNLVLMVSGCASLVSYLLASGYDQTRKDTEQQMLQLSRTASLGLISGGFAHEVNTPLAIISLNTEVLDSMTESGELDTEELKKRVASIQRSTEKISKLTQTILANAREDQTPSFQICNVQSIVEQTISLCEERIVEAGIQLRVDPNLNQIQFECRPVQISQALFNIVYNSIEALSVLNEKWIHISAQSYSDSIEITVTDSGPGIPKKIQAKLFTPFFTTKDVGRGYGLGLANCASTVHLHHGQIYLDPEQPNTTFVMRLPKQQPA